MIATEIETPVAGVFQPFAESSAGRLALLQGNTEAATADWTVTVIISETVSIV